MEVGNSETCETDSVPALPGKIPPRVDSSKSMVMSGTLKRNPKMEMNRTDLLQLLSHLEGEVQARDVAIATLKLDQVKHMLSRAKYGWSEVSDPVCALQRDSEISKDGDRDAEIRGIYGNQLVQLERLISTQRSSQQQMREQLVAVEKQYHKTCAELEEMEQKHMGEMDLAEKVTCLLEKDRDRYRKEVENLDSRCKQLEADLKAAKENQHEDQSLAAKHRQVALVLLRERSRLVLKLLEAREQCTELERTVKEEREHSSTLEENLERQSNEYEQLCARLSAAESLNRILQSEIDKLRSSASASPASVTEAVSGAAADSLPRINTDSSSRVSTAASWPLASVNGVQGSDSPRSSVESIPTSSDDNVAAPAYPFPLEDRNAVPPPADWKPLPMDRVAAAARLRSVLSAAIDGRSGPPPASSHPDLAAHSNHSQPAFPSTVRRSTPSVAWMANSAAAASGNKLPVVAAGISSGHPVNRSNVLQPSGSVVNLNHSPPISDGKPLGRLAPLNPPASARLAPLPMAPSQSNGFPARSGSLMPKPPTGSFL